MDVSWLQDFLALAETGNFSRAAARRNITQPAFSRRIRLLEDWVGAPLVDRSTHQAALTPAGERFRPAAIEVLRRLLLGQEGGAGSGACQRRHAPLRRDACAVPDLLPGLAARTGGGGADRGGQPGG